MSSNQSASSQGLPESDSAADKLAFSRHVVCLPAGTSGLKVDEPSSLSIMIDGVDFSRYSRLMNLLLPRTYYFNILVLPLGTTFGGGVEALDLL